MSIPMKKLGTQGLEVAGLGYGAMGLTAFYGEPVSDEHGIAIMKRAVELGVTMLDTAEVYRSAFDGTGKLNEELVGKAIEAIGRDKIVIATKHRPGGLLGQKCETKEELRTVIKSACENSLKALGVSCIDLYYLHRMYPAPHTIEDVMEVFKELVEENKIKYVGLSEASSDFIRRAHAIIPISALQQEWSLIARDLEESGGPVETCRELGIGIVPYSPIARGFLAGAHQDEKPNDWRGTIPYMQDDVRASNVEVVKEIEAMAKEKDLTLAQLSLAWVYNQGDDVCPIPGTTKLSHLEGNIKAASVKLTPDELKKIGDAASKIKGERGDEGYMKRSYHTFKKK